MFCKNNVGTDHRVAALRGQLHRLIEGISERARCDVEQRVLSSVQNFLWDRLEMISGQL